MDSFELIIGDNPGWLECPPMGTRRRLFDDLGPGVYPASLAAWPGRMFGRFLSHNRESTPPAAWPQRSSMTPAHHPYVRRRRLSRHLPPDYLRHNMQVEAAAHRAKPREPVRMIKHRRARVHAKRRLPTPAAVLPRNVAMSRSPTPVRTATS